MGTGEQEEKRHFIRIPMDGGAHLHCAEQRWDAELLDISLKGALIATPKSWTHTDAPCRLDIMLGDGDMVISMQGQVTHTEANHIGFRCDQIDLESISHLKRLVELNLGDEHLLERELHELINFRG